MTHQGTSTSDTSLYGSAPSSQYASYPQTNGSLAQGHGTTVAIGYTPVALEEGASFTPQPTYTSAATPLFTSSYLPHGQALIDLKMVMRIPLYLTLIQFICLGVPIILCATLKFPVGSRPLFVAAFAGIAWTIAQICVTISPFRTTWLLVLFGVCNAALSAFGAILTLAFLKGDSFRAGVDWAIFYTFLEVSWLLIVIWIKKNNEKTASSIV